MKTEKNNVYNNIIMLLVFLLGVCSVFTFMPKEKSATDVYNLTFNAIVELKAYDDEAETSFGSAVCVSNDGLFVTNAHVVTYIEQAQEKAYSNIEIRFPDCSEFEKVTLVKFDRSKDMALFKYAGEHKINSLQINTRYNTGDKCYAVGNAQNYGISISEGVISKQQAVVENGNQTITAIQCGLNITDGNSGGALLNENGQLIGITTFRTKDNLNNVVYGMCFALQATDVKDFIEDEVN